MRRLQMETVIHKFFRQSWEGHRLHSPSFIYIFRRPDPAMQNGMALAIAIAVDKQFGGSRDSLGVAAQLHHSIVASSLSRTVYISLTTGYLTP